MASWALIVNRVAQKHRNPKAMQLRWRNVMMSSAPDFLQGRMGGSGRGRHALPIAFGNAAGLPKFATLGFGRGVHFLNGSDQRRRTFPTSECGNPDKL